jgi:triosephosphate isomerase
LPPETVAAGMVIAYEPLWAIGTGQAATPEDAQDACLWIRELVGRSLESQKPRTLVRIQYGGSVNAENADALVRMPGRRRCPDRRGASLDMTANSSASSVLPPRRCGECC